MIDFEGVSVTYTGASAPVLTDVDLHLPEGELCLVVGPTGGGKSTLLRCVNGLVPHFTGGRLDGRVTVAGRDTRTHPPRELADVVGVVLQDPLAGFVTDVVEDELANPLLGIAAPPGRHPWQAHARGLIAHLIYGVATDVALCNPLISMTRRMSAFSKCVTRTTMPCRYIQCRSTILTPSSDIAISRL